MTMSAATQSNVHIIAAFVTIPPLGRSEVPLRCRPEELGSVLGFLR